MVLSDWKKVEDNVWRRKKSFAGSFQFVWIDFKNRVRVSEGSFSDFGLSVDIVKESAVLGSFSSGVKAKKFVMDYLRSN